jgi:DNA mismatch endonuclease (patch repair protein)
MILRSPEAGSAAVRAVMRANRKIDTKPELLLRRALYRAGVRYRVNLRIKAEGGPVRPDVTFPRRRLAVFVDGCFWHRCPEHGLLPKSNTQYWAPKLNMNVVRDQSVNERLSRGGWSVIRVWEHEDPSEAASRVLAAYRSRGGAQ